MTDRLPTDAAERKGIPVITGCLDYFPDAIAAVAHLSKVANEQHNPGQPMHWSKDKSTDHADCIGRHLIQRGTIDTDGMRHSAKVAWRALALLQTELEAETEGVGVGGPALDPRAAGLVTVPCASFPPFNIAATSEAVRLSPDGVRALLETKDRTLDEALLAGDISLPEYEAFKARYGRDYKS